MKKSGKEIQSPKGAAKLIDRLEDIRAEKDEVRRKMRPLMDKLQSLEAEEGAILESVRGWTR